MQQKIAKRLTTIYDISEFGAVQKNAPWFCLAALAANAAAFGRSLRWVFQGFPISEKKKVQKNANLVDLEKCRKMSIW